jgi:ubiquinone biosynthesis protein COQ4
VTKDDPTMTATAPSINDQPSAFQRPRRDWGRALRALGRLFADKEDTSQVFEIMRALNGGATPKGYMRLLHSPGGGRLAYERVELAPRLMDDAWLDTFAAGSVGAAYRDFVRGENLSADGLAEESRRGLANGAIDQPHPFAWYGRRIRDTHDIWHVLTGYGRDGLGELCLVAFSYSQTRAPGWALIGWGGFLRAGGKAGRPYRKAILEGFRRGKTAAWLPGEDYERLLAEPLGAARRRLGIAPAAAYEAIPADRRLRA